MAVKKNIHPDTLGYNREIGKKVRELSPNHNVKDIFAAIQSYGSAPGSLKTFYKYYGNDLREPRMNLTNKIGDKVAEQALDGDFKSQEFWLRARGGWTTKDVVETRELGTEEEENEGHVNALLTALGLNTEEDD